MVEFRCRDCRWFDQKHKSLAGVGADFGYCRKHKPIIYQVEQRYYGGWPLVDINDLCGEFRLNDEGVNP